MPSLDLSFARMPAQVAAVLDVAVMAPMTRPESTGPHSMVSGSSSEPTGLQPQDDRARLTGKGFTTPGPSGRARA